MLYSSPVRTLSRGQRAQTRRAPVSSRRAVPRRDSPPKLRQSVAHHVKRNEDDGNDSDDFKHLPASKPRHKQDDRAVRVRRGGAGIGPRTERLAQGVTHEPGREVGWCYPADAGPTKRAFAAPVRTGSGLLAARILATQEYVDHERTRPGCCGLAGHSTVGRYPAAVDEEECHDRCPRAHRRWAGPRRRSGVGSDPEAVRAGSAVPAREGAGRGSRPGPDPHHAPHRSSCTVCPCES